MMTYRPQSRKWTSEEDRQLAILWNAGWRTQSITSRFEGRSRNSILGRALRLKLPRRESPIPKAKPCSVKAREIEAGRLAAIQEISQAT